jgi:tripeptide aminopeptidase
MYICINKNLNMTENKLNRLKEVLSVPTHSRDEKLMIEYLQKVLTEKGYEHFTDNHGNIYVKKGDTKHFPCFVAHTDTVHRVNLNLTVIESEDKKLGKILTGIDKKTGRPSGIGGDDKCGVFLALEMLDTLPNVKAAFFVSEEIGCKGSMYADSKFFEDIGYVIQYDSPGGDSMSLTLMGRYLFNQESEFANKVTGLITEHGINDWAYHPYTDVWQLMEKFNIATLNLAAGYYRYHTDNEFVLVNDVQNSFELGLKLVESLGEKRYENPKEDRYGTQSKMSKYFKDDKKQEAKKTLLLEEGEEETDDDFNSGEFFYTDKNRRRIDYGYYNRNWEY